MIQDIDIRLLCRNTGQIEGLPKNPRFIRDEKFELLKKSIQENPEMLGLRELLVYPQQAELGTRYIVIGGNMRLEACKALGYKTVPCKVLDAATTVEQLKAYTVKDNAGFGEWDWDMLANEWDSAQLTEWGVDVPVWDVQTDDDDRKDKTVQEDNFDEDKDKVETVCKEGDLWQLGDHRLLCGDSTKAEDVQRLMQGELADLWLTDPPYNVNYQGGTGLKIQNDSMSDQEYQAFLFAAFSAAKSVLKAGCPFYVWTAQGHAMADNINALDKVGLFFKQQLIWVKSSFVLGHMDYHGRHEPCLYGWKEGAGHYFVHERNHSTVYSDAEELDIDKMKKEEMRKLLHQIFEEKHPTTVINCEKPPRSKDHPTMKPVKLFGYLTRNSSQRGEIILDTFGGSGTTIVACEQLNRKARIMELDPHYCDVIIARWEKLTGQKAVRLTD